GRAFGLAGVRGWGAPPPAVPRQLPYEVQAYSRADDVGLAHQFDVVSLAGKQQVRQIECGVFVVQGERSVGIHMSRSSLVVTKELSAAPRCRTMGEMHAMVKGPACQHSG